MSSIERTAYPRFSSTRIIKEKELEKFYSLTADEEYYINNNIRGAKLKLNFAAQLKAFQRLGYFPELKEIPDVIVQHIKYCFRLADSDLNVGYDHDTTLYRHRDRICSYLNVSRWQRNNKRKNGEPAHPGRHLAVQIAHQAAQTMNNPADIINVVIEELIRHHYELPSFYQLNMLVKHTRSVVNRRIFININQQLETNMLEKLDELLVLKSGCNRTGYNALKKLPKNPTISHIKELIDHYHWLKSFGKIDCYISNVSKTKLQQFATEAKS